MVMEEKNFPVKIEEESCEGFPDRIASKKFRVGA
jgi:hypothetical protein